MGQTHTVIEIRCAVSRTLRYDPRLGELTTTLPSTAADAILDAETAVLIWSRKTNSGFFMRPPLYASLCCQCCS